MSGRGAGQNNLEFYDTVATATDYLTSPLTLGEQRMCAWLRSKTGPLLEVGCGAGRLYPHLVGAPGDLIGLDYAAKPLRMHRERHPEADLVLGSAVDLPFQSQSFANVLFGYHMIESILPASSRAAALASAGRVLRDGGILILTRHQRLGYERRLQLLSVFRRGSRSFGELSGDSRTVGDAQTTPQFRMQVLSKRELTLQAQAAGLIWAGAWNFDSGGHARPWSRAVVELYRREPSVKP